MSKESESSFPLECLEINDYVRRSNFEDILFSHISLHVSQLGVFRPRATLKGPKRSFAVLVVVVVHGVKSSSKNVRGNKKCLWEHKLFVGTKIVRGNKKMFLGTKNVLGNKNCSYKSK